MQSVKEDTPLVKGSQMKTERHKFICQLFKDLQPLDYIWLEIAGADPNEITETADLDLLLPKKQFERIIKIIQLILNGGKFSTNKTCNGRSIIINFDDKSFIRINIFSQISERGWTLLNNTDVISKSHVSESGIRTLCVEHFFELHFLKSCIRSVDMPQSVVRIFKQKNFSARSEVFGHVSYKYRLIIHKLEELYEHNIFHRKSILSYLRNMRSNNVISRIHFGVTCGLRHIHFRLQCPTLILASSGDDPQLLANVQGVLEQKYNNKTIALDLSAYNTLHRIPQDTRGKSFSLAFLRPYLYLRYLLLNYTVLIAGDNTSSSSHILNHRTKRGYTRIVLKDIKDTSNDSDRSSFFDIFNRMGINPDNYAVIRIDHIRVDQENDLLMKESVIAN